MRLSIWFARAAAGVSGHTDDKHPKIEDADSGLGCVAAIAFRESYTDMDFIDFATNVECLEGLFDTWGTFGRGFLGALCLATVLTVFSGNGSEPVSCGYLCCILAMRKVLKCT